MNSVKLDLAINLTDKIAALKQFKSLLETNRMHCLPDMNNHCSIRQGGLSLNDYLPKEKLVRDILLKNVNADLVRYEREFAAL